MFLEGNAVELFVGYARVDVKNIMKIRSKMAVKGRFATQWTQFLVVSLLRSLVLARLHLSQELKIRDFVRKLDKILTCSFLFSAWSISRLFLTKKHKKTRVWQVHCLILGS